MVVMTTSPLPPGYLTIISFYDGFSEVFFYVYGWQFYVFFFSYRMALGRSPYRYWLISLGFY